MKSPKVLIIIATGIVGGPGKGLFQLIRNLSKLDFKYVLCNFSIKGNKNYEFANIANMNNLNIKFLEQKRLFDFSLIRQAYEIYKIEDCNIIQTHGYKSHIIGWVLKKKYNVKWIAVVNGWTNENYKIRVYNKIDELVLRSADTVITVSPKLKDYVINKIRRGKNTEMILNAVDEDEIVSADQSKNVIESIIINKKNKFLIGVFGRLSPEKGHIVLLNAIRQVVKVYDNINIIIAGDGPCRDMIEKKINDYSLGDSVNLIGYQAGMRDLYEAIDLLVLPSLSEGLPNVILEAMIMDKPVLATNVGGVNEIIVDNVNGWVIKPGCSLALAAKIIEILNNPTVLDKVGLVVRDSLLPKFSPATRAQNYLNVYKKLLSV